MDLRLRAPAHRPAGTDTPVARPKSLLTGKDTKVTWSANWDDSLAGGNEIAAGDPILQQLSDQVRQEYEKAFLFFLPRICEHCLNPSCAASCPSGAIYKRAEDGIVLVDQDRCRGWRMCVTGCPYKKIYFNHRTGKAEKCTFCFPRIEIGQPTICSETCVGRLRYLGLMLYDADRVGEAAAVEGRARAVRGAAVGVPRPERPQVVAAAARGRHPRRLDRPRRSAPRSGTHHGYEVALPLHPEYRTMPMVWYIPPLSPVVDVLRDTGHDGEDAGNLFGAVDALRIPVDYLAGLFTAGDPAPVTARAAAPRRDARLPAADQPRRGPRRVHRRRGRHDRRSRWTTCTACSPSPSTRSGTSSRPRTPRTPTASSSSPPSAASTTRAGRAWAARARSANRPGGPAPISVENFHMLRDRQTADTIAAPADKDGPGQPAELGRQGPPRRLFPPSGRTGTGHERRRAVRGRSPPGARVAAAALPGRRTLLGRPADAAARRSRRCPPAIAGPCGRRRPPGRRRPDPARRRLRASCSTSGGAAACT